MELIIIFDEKDEVTVSIATQILEENGIPSIHISGGGKYPLKTGLRVKYDAINGRLPEILDYIEVNVPTQRINEYIDKHLNSPDTGIGKSKVAYA